MRENVYQRLAKHLSSLGMGYPEKEELLEILRENFTPLEAEVALAIPTKVIPFEPVPVGEIVPPSHPSEEAGLVHLVDNAREGIKHTCNCSGCCCWSVGTIRRKKIPRDMLMATYFLRETDQELITKQSTRVTYWEGSVKVQGKYGNHPAKGMGGLEKV